MKAPHRHLLLSLATVCAIAVLTGCAAGQSGSTDISTNSNIDSGDGNDIEAINKRADALLKNGSVEEAQMLYHEAVALLDEKLGEDYYSKIDTLAEETRTSLDSVDGEARCRRLIAIDADMSIPSGVDLAQDLSLYSQWLRGHKQTELADDLARLSERCKLPGEATRARNAEICSALKLDPPNEDDLIVHPVLHVGAGHPFDKAKIDDTTFIKLSGYVMPSGAYKGRWIQYFFASEKEAAEEFCVQARGLTKKQVERLGGRPLYQGGKVDCWNFGGSDDEVWVYCFGGNSVFARLAFARDRCTASEIVGESDCSKYLVWRPKKLESSTIGKPIFMVLEEQGPPSFIVSDRDNQSLDSSPLDYKIIGYQTGPSNHTELTFLYGICVKAESCNGEIKFQ
jgi:hypothetical protein